jgi:hypothetical protein
MVYSLGAVLRARDVRGAFVFAAPLFFLAARGALADRGSFAATLRAPRPRPFFG